MNDFSSKPKIIIDNKKIIISNFSKEKLTQNDVSDLYFKLIQLTKEKPISIEISLLNLSVSDMNLMAFIDTCHAVSLKYGIKLIFVDKNEIVLDALAKISVFETSKENKFKKIVDYRRTSAFTSIGENSFKFGRDVRNFLGFVGEISSVLFDSLFHLKKVQWKETLYYMEKTGADGVPIVLLLCFLMGGIISFQGIFQMGKFGLAEYSANLVGLVLVKELAALMVAMICIGRAGSAFAAEIGTMKVAEEIDAMTTMGLRTSRFIVIPKVLALVCMMPLLTVIGDLAGVFGGMLVAVMLNASTFSQYYISTIAAIDTSSLLEGIVKSIVFAVLISVIGCLRGYEADCDAKGVGKAATSSVVSGIFLIIIADGIITVLFS